MAAGKVSYLADLRQVVGKRKLITPGVRALVLDAHSGILLVRRRDNGRWAFPAGGLELEESILDCLHREVMEETGLQVLEARLFAIYSEPRFSATNAAGELQQKLTIAFIVDQWAGQLLTTTDETTDARFYPLDALPELAPYHQEAIEDLKTFQGSIILK